MALPVFPDEVVHLILARTTPVAATQLLSTCRHYHQVLRPEHAPRLDSVKQQVLRERFLKEFQRDVLIATRQFWRHHGGGGEIMPIASCWNNHLKPHFPTRDRYVLVRRPLLVTWLRLYVHIYELETEGARYDTAGLMDNLKITFPLPLGTSLNSIVCDDMLDHIHARVTTPQKHRLQFIHCYLDQLAERLFRWNRPGTPPTPAELRHLQVLDIPER